MYMKFMSPLDDAYLCIWNVECVLSLTETLSLSASAAVFCAMSEGGSNLEGSQLAV